MSLAILLDIREPYHGQRPGAVQIPLGILLADIDRLSTAQEYSVVGQDERDADLAARLLRQQGLNAWPLSTSR